MKTAMLALVVKFEKEAPSLVEILSDDREIRLFEGHIAQGDGDPLQKVYEVRELQNKEDSEFADYVEDLLSQPFVRTEIREHGVQWLKSKIRIEQYQRNEAEAAKIIAEYALKLFQSDKERTDFFLAGPSSKVRVRIFVLDQVAKSSQQAA